jgi:hypothetical protein
VVFREIDFGAVIYQAGLAKWVNDAYFSAEKKQAADNFLKKFKEEHPKKLERLVVLNETLLDEAASLSKLLDEFMRANLLGLQSTANLPGLKPTA